MTRARFLEVMSIVFRTHPIFQEQRRSEIIAESNGAYLVQKTDGTNACICPFACMAACEPCEFGLC